MRDWAPWRLRGAEILRRCRCFQPDDCPKLLRGKPVGDDIGNVGAAAGAKHHVFGLQAVFS
jgi:hypothetical protein